jgi:hypothetical protein
MMELPRYSKITADELRELEEEFGAPLTEELALWLIRNRTNREAIERMIEEEAPKDRRVTGRRSLKLVA